MPHVWDAARRARASLDAAPDFRAAAAEYCRHYPRHPPDYFVDRSRELTRRAFDGGDGWACRLLSCLETPAHFSLHTQHLGLDRSAAAPSLLFDRGNVALWKQAIMKHFRGPCRWRLELGVNGRIHCHVVANCNDGPPDLPRTGEIVKPCETYFEQAIRYVLKPPLTYTAEHLAIWLEAKRRGRLPRLSGSSGVPTRRTWSEPSRLRDYFAKSPETEPETTAPKPAKTGKTTAPKSVPPKLEIEINRGGSLTAESRRRDAATIRPNRTAPGEVRERGPPPPRSSDHTLTSVLKGRPNMDELTEARTELTAAEHRISEARQNRDAAKVQLDEAETAFRAACTAATAHRQRIAQLESEPQRAELYQQRLEQLRAALRSAPASSPTGQRVRRDLDRLTASQEPPSEKLGNVTHLLESARNHYKLDRETWDAATPGIVGREMESAS